MPIIKFPNRSDRIRSIVRDAILASPLGEFPEIVEEYSLFFSKKIEENLDFHVVLQMELPDYIPQEVVDQFKPFIDASVGEVIEQFRDRISGLLIDMSSIKLSQLRCEYSNKRCLD